MANRYGITRLVAGSPPFLEISEEEHEEGVCAKERLLEVLYWEEKFDYVIGNLLELETALLNAGLEVMTRGRPEPAWMSNQRDLVERKIANLLTTTRMYLDHTDHHFSKMYGKESKQSSEIERIKHDIYESSVEYRIMEEIRNTVQHRGFSVHSISFPGTTVQRDDDHLIEFSCVPYVVPDQFREDDKFKRSVFEELEQLGENVDLRGLIRKYIECLWSLHEGIRQMIGEDINEWDASVDTLIDKYNEVADDNHRSGDITLVKVIDEKYQETHGIFKRVIERRKDFVRKNSNLANLANRFVSNEA